MGILLDKIGTTQARIHSIQPRSVSTHFALVPEGLKSVERKKVKKRNTIELVKRMLNDPKKLTASVKFKKFFMEMEKKDDLSDCLLIGMGWIDWVRYSRNLSLELLGK